MRRKLEQQQGLLDEPAELEESDFLESIARTIFRKGGGLLGELLNPAETGLDEGYLDDQGRLVVTEPLVRERNFRNWFGDSKMVDEEGKPLVVYHGTGRNFESFDPSASPKNSYSLRGIYTAKNPRTAEEYVPHEFMLKPKYDEEMEAAFSQRDKLNRLAERPLISAKNESYPIPDLELPKINENFFPEEAQEIQRNQRIIDFYTDKLNWEDPKYTKKDFRGSVLPVNISMKTPFVYDWKGDAWSQEGERRVMDALRDSGGKDAYDGVIFKNIYDGEAGVIDDVYIPFEPTQIKSIHNRGTYNPDDPDLLGMNTMNMSLLYG